MINISKENKGFGLLELSAHAANCIAAVYFILYFKSLGYSGTKIGLMVSATYFLNMAAQMIVGYLSDSVVTIKKIYGFNMVTAFFCVMLMPFNRNTFYLIFFLYAAFTITGGISVSVLDTYVAKLSKIRSGLDYSFVRSFGSFGYAFMAVLAGFLVNRYGYNVIFVLHSVCILFSFFVLLKLEDVPINNKKQPDVKKESFLSILSILLKTKGYLIAIIACLFTFVGTGMAGIYLGFNVLELGGNSTHVGIATFCSAFSEVPVMLNYRRLTRRFAEWQLLLFAFFMFALKIFLVTIFFSVNGIICIQLLQSVSYGIYMPAMLGFMSKTIPSKVMATGIMIWLAASVALSNTIASFCGGYIIEYYGAHFLYSVSTACCLIGAGLIGVMLFRMRKNLS